MMAESLVAIMATIAACVLQPGIYLAINSPAGIVGQLPEAAAATISGWGFPVTAADMQALAQAVGEQTLFNRTGGAPAFAGPWLHFLELAQRQTVMASGTTSRSCSKRFHLTILDAGTRVRAFMLQDALGHIWKPLSGPVGIRHPRHQRAHRSRRGSFWQGVKDHSEGPLALAIVRNLESAVTLPCA
jgi:carbon starvation protein